MNDKIYLIKMMRILLEALTPSRTDLEMMRSQNKEDQSSAQKKLKDFQHYQDACIDQGLHTLALHMLKEHAPFNVQTEALQLIIAMLQIGNKNTQYKILKLLSHHDRKLCAAFFSFLRHFFQTNLEKELALMKQARIEAQELKNQNNNMNLQQQAAANLGNNNNKKQGTQFEILSTQILKMIALFCENVNRSFQKFLRQQSQNESLLANTNVVLEISNFLAFFLEDSQLRTHDKDSLIVQSLDTLSEICTGQPLNQQIVCTNSFKKNAFFI